MSPEPLVVIGVGPEGPAGLSAEARAQLEQAQVLVGGKRNLDLFPGLAGRRIVIGSNLDGLAPQIRQARQAGKTVVLASGDPLFYGIGRLLRQAFAAEELVFLPHLSSIQLAFARIKETWHDACVVSLHGRQLADLMPALRRKEPKIALLTDPCNHPAAIARFVHRQAPGDYVLHVCENLGGPDERITCWAPDELRELAFSPLNVVVLLLRPRVPVGSAEVPLLGIAENLLRHRAGIRGMITHREVRLMALAYLELHPGEVLWDIGAGSGSVAIEAARLSDRLEVIAIERDAEACTMLAENVRAFAPDRVRIIAGEAPEALVGLPQPAAVFVGGSGGRLADLLPVVIDRLAGSGRLVISAITLETLSSTWSRLQQAGLEPIATSVHLAHSRPLGSLSCLEPDLPLFLVRATKP